MQQRDTSAQRVPLVLGAVLVGVGIVFLVAQQMAVDIGAGGWPLWVLIPGVVILAGGLAVGGEVGSGFSAVGSMIAMTGLLLFYQDRTGHWESWAYAWALVAPGAVGAGLFLHGLVSGRPDLVRGGAAAATTGVAIFLVGALFFEVLLGIGGHPLGQTGDMLLPAAVVVLGVLILAGAFFPGRVTPGAPARPGGGPIPDAPPPTPPSPVGPGGPGMTAQFRPVSGAVHVDGPAAYEAGSGLSGVGGAPDATAGAHAGAQPGPRADARAAGSPGSAESLAFDLAGALRADVQLEFGAGRLFVSGAAPGRLLDGSFSAGSVRHEVSPDGQIRLSNAVMPVGWAGWPPHEWHVGISTEVPVRLRVATGASEAELDLSSLRVQELQLKVGASETRVRLPANAGATLVDAEVGAAKLLLQVPAGVAARIRTAMTLGSVDVDNRRFPQVPGGFASPDYEQAQNRVEIDFRGGVGSLEVR